MSEPDWVIINNNNSIFYSHSSNNAQPDNKESWGPLSFGLANFSIQVVIQALNASATIISEGRYPFSLSQEQQQQLRRQLEAAAVHLDDKYSDRLSGQLSPQELLHFTAVVDNLKAERTKKSLLSQSRSSSPPAAATTRPTSGNQTTSIPLEELEDRLLARSRAQQQHNQSSAPSIRAPTELNNIPRNTSASPTPVASSSAASASTGNNNNNNNNITISSSITNNNQNQNKNSSSLKVTFVEPSANNNNYNNNTNNSMMSTGNSNNNNNSSSRVNNNYNHLLHAHYQIEDRNGNINHKKLTEDILGYFDNSDIKAGQQLMVYVRFSAQVKGQIVHLEWHGQLHYAYSKDQITKRRLRDNNGNLIKVLVATWPNVPNNQHYEDLITGAIEYQNTVLPFPAESIRYARITIPATAQHRHASTASAASNPSMSGMGDVPLLDTVTLDSSSDDDNNDDDQQQDQRNRRSMNQNNNNNNNGHQLLPPQPQQQTHNFSSSSRAFASPQPIHPGGFGGNGFVSGGGMVPLASSYFGGNPHQQQSYQNTMEKYIVEHNKEVEREKLLMPKRFVSHLATLLHHPFSTSIDENVATWVRGNYANPQAENPRAAIEQDVFNYIQYDLGIDYSVIKKYTLVEDRVESFKYALHDLGNFDMNKLAIYMEKIEFFKRQRILLLSAQTAHELGVSHGAVLNEMMKHSLNIQDKAILQAGKNVLAAQKRNKKNNNNRSNSSYNNRSRSSNNRGGGYINNNGNKKNNNNNEDFKSKPCDKCASEGKQQAYYYCTEHNKNARGSLNSSAPPRS